MGILDRLEENRRKETDSNSYYRGYMHALRDLENLIDSSERLNDEALLEKLCEAILNREIL